jgi:hypothetical protein
MLFYLEKQRISVGLYADLYKSLELGGDIYVFDQELEEVYNTNLTGNYDDNNEIFDYSIKPNKTD